MRCTLLTSLMIFILSCLSIELSAEADVPPVEPELLKKIVTIETISSLTKTGRTGTGFIVSQLMKKPLVRLFFLVTTKQMVSDYHLSDFRINEYNKYLDVYFYDNDGVALWKPKRIPLYDSSNKVRDDIIYVHDDPSVDVAIIFLHEDLRSSDGIALDAFDTSYLRSFDTISDSGSTIGTQVFVPGHPTGMNPVTDRYPVVNVGVLASRPEEIIDLEVSTTDRAGTMAATAGIRGKLLIIDGLNTTGNIGEPVILPSMIEATHDTDTNTLQHKNSAKPHLVIGIKAGTSGSSGLSYSFCADYIVETIHQFLAQRGTTAYSKWP